MMNPAGRFWEKFKEFGGLEGEFSLEQIKNRRDELCNIYRRACPSLFGSSHPSEMDIHDAADELIDRSLDFSIREFDKRQKAKIPDSCVPFDILCADIMTDVRNLRARVQDMQLPPEKAAFFYERINDLATLALKDSEASPEKAADLLGIGPARPDLAAPDSSTRPQA